MTLKRFAAVFCAALILVGNIFVYADLDVESVASKASGIRSEAAKNITVTDVRNQIKNVTMTGSQIQEIVVIVNDYYNNTFANLDYYQNISDNFNADEIETIYNAVQNPVKPADYTMLILAAGGALVIIIAVILLMLVFKKTKGKKTPKKPDSKPQNDDEEEDLNYDNMTENSDTTIPEPQSSTEDYDDFDI